MSNSKYTFQLIKRCPIDQFNFLGYFRNYIIMFFMQIDQQKKFKTEVLLKKLSAVLGGQKARDMNCFKKAKSYFYVQENCHMSKFPQDGYIAYFMSI